MSVRIGVYKYKLFKYLESKVLLRSRTVCFKSVIKLFVLLPLLFVVLTPSLLSAFDVSQLSFRNISHICVCMALFYIYSKIRREEFEVPNSRPLRIHPHFNKHRIEATVELMEYTLGETYFFQN